MKGTVADLRTALGWTFLWAFLDKTFALGFATGRAEDGTIDFLGDAAWISGGSPTAGFLTFATGGPFAGFFQSFAGPAWEPMPKSSHQGRAVHRNFGLGKSRSPKPERLGNARRPRHDRTLSEDIPSLNAYADGADALRSLLKQHDAQVAEQTRQQAESLWRTKFPSTCSYGGRSLTRCLLWLQPSIARRCTPRGPRSRSTPGLLSLLLSLVSQWFQRAATPLPTWSGSGLPLSASAAFSFMGAAVTPPASSTIGLSAFF